MILYYFGLVAILLAIVFYNDYKLRRYKELFLQLSEIEREQREKLYDMAITGREVLLNHAIAVTMLEEKYGEEKFERDFMIKKKQMISEGFELDDYLNKLIE